MVIYSEADHWRRIARNLLDNAIKFTEPRGHVSLTISSTENGITLTISDTGLGISPEDQFHIFERFYRASPARLAEGSGLGLSIVKTLVENMGGNITVESQLGQGSTFVVTIPTDSVSSLINKL